MMFKKFIVDILNQVNLMFNTLNGKNIDKSIEGNSNIKDDPIDMEDLKIRLENHKTDYDKRMENERNSYKRQVEELREKILSMKDEINEFIDLYGYCRDNLTNEEMNVIYKTVHEFNIGIDFYDYIKHVIISIGDPNIAKNDVLERKSNGLLEINYNCDLAKLKKFYKNFPIMKKKFIFKVNKI